MAYYMNKHTYWDGVLVLFQRDQKIASPNSKSHRAPAWYMKLKLSSQQEVQASTKLTDLNEALTYAKKEFYRLQSAIQKGQSLEGFSFEKHWKDWFQRQVNQGIWSESRRKWHENYAKRYFLPYFSNKDGSSMRMSEINLHTTIGYWDWRISFWSTGPGLALRKSNPKRRKAKSKSTFNAVKKPSVKTLKMEQSALNQIFNYAIQHGRCDSTVKFSAPVKKGPPNRRPHFETNGEYDLMIRNLRSYRDSVGVFANKGVNKWHSLHKQQLYYFVLFLANSGLRPGEAREMVWSDVQFDIAVDGTDRKIAEVRVSKHTKKGIARYVQTQANTNDYLKRWREISPFKGKDQLVWFGQSKDQDGHPKKFTDLNKSFQFFLSQIPNTGRDHGLLYNRDGEKRTLYSLRHTYATYRLESGVSDTDVAMNMGCSTKQIKDHYGHVDVKNRRSEITKMKPKMHWSGFQQITSSPDKDDQFILDAVSRWKLGKMDDSALLAVFKSPDIELSVKNSPELS